MPSLHHFLLTVGMPQSGERVARGDKHHVQAVALVFSEQEMIV